MACRTFPGTSQDLAKIPNLLLQFCEPCLHDGSRLAVSHQVKREGLVAFRRSQLVNRVANLRAG